MSEVNIDSTNPKIQRTILRFKSKVEQKDYYEAHQTLRSIINRFVKGNQLDNSIELIYHGSLIFIDHEQFASAADLLEYFVEILKNHKVEADEALMGKIVTIIKKFPVGEPSFNKISNGFIDWNCENSKYKLGDPQLHDILGVKFLNVEEMNERSFVKAQRHLVLGTHNSFKPLLELVWDWYLDYEDYRVLPQLLGGVVVNYLVVKNIKSAKKFFFGFFELFYKKYSVTELPYKKLEIDQFYKIFLFEQKELNFLNFCQLAILTVQMNNKDLFIKLKNTYSIDIENSGARAAVDTIGKSYFDIQVQKQVNVLQEMMSGFFKK